MADTLTSRLNSLRWQFQEKGMHRIWNELKSLALAANTTQHGDGDLQGDLDWVDNCNPDVIPRTGKTEDDRDGTGTRYPEMKFPPHGGGSQFIG